MPLPLEATSSATILELPRHQTIFLIPVGPLENHGSHLPLGMDAMEARAVCTKLASQIEERLPGWRTVLVPPFFSGLDANTRRLAFTTRGHVLRDYLIDFCKPLAREGFRYFFCYSGHPGPRQLTAIEEAGQMLRRQLLPLGPAARAKWKNRPHLVSLSSAGVPFGTVMRSPLWPDAEEHGGRRDTSVALHIAPELVKPGYENLPARKAEISSWRRALKRFSGKNKDYWGDPAKAQADEGELAIERICEDLFPKLRAVLEGSEPSKIFRSWYSVFPPNRSFFKAWILAFLLFGMLLIWAYLIMPL